MSEKPNLFKIEDRFDIPAVVDDAVPKLKESKACLIIWMDKDGITNFSRAGFYKDMLWMLRNALFQFEKDFFE